MNKKIIILATFLILITFISTGCLNTNKTKMINNTESKQAGQISKEIGPQGGSLNIVENEDNLTLSVPAGALDSQKEITFSLAENKTEVKSGIPSNISIEISPKINFDKPVKIIISSKNSKVRESQAIIPYLIKEDGSLSLAQLVSRNKETGTFSIETFHSGKYMWVYVE